MTHIRIKQRIEWLKKMSKEITQKRERLTEIETISFFDTKFKSLQESLNKLLQPKLKKSITDETTGSSISEFLFRKANLKFVYEGALDDKFKFHGQGEICGKKVRNSKWKNEYFKGGFQHGKYHGFGVLVSDHGLVKIGNFDKGKMYGFGIMVELSGIIRIGNFNGYIFGPVKTYDVNGGYLGECKYSKGKIVKGF